jgi:superfamily I DNA/RNA helicase
MFASTYQENIYKWVSEGSGNAVVNAKAGSGKTTTAINAVDRMSGDVLMLAFNKKIATELQNRLVTMGYPNASAATFHSESLKSLAKAKGKMSVNNSKVYNFVEYFTQEGELMKCRKAIMDMVRFAKEYGFGVSGCNTVDDINAWVNIIQHNDIDIDADVSLETIIDVCQKVLDLNNRDVKSIDFSDMLYFPLLFDVDMIQYDWIIVDEAQDTNVCRKLLLKKMLKPGGRLIAIGDPNQAIYGFTGAENNSMELIKTMFDAVELPLSVCYRCGKNIITAAKEYVADIEAFENNNDGEISSIKYDEFVKSTPSLNLNKKDGIICRNNSPLVALAFALIREGIGCRIEGKDIGQNLITLTRKWKVKDLATFTLRLQKHFDRESEKASKAKLALLEDKFDTMMILIERCQTLGKHDVASLQKLISDMFSDNDDYKKPNVVTLSSIHKSKGLEFDNCYILGMSQFQPSKYAVLDWMKEQEKNLSYVAITRAKNKLVHITDCPTRGNKEAE